MKSGGENIILADKLRARQLETRRLLLFTSVWNQRPGVSKFTANFECKSANVVLTDVASVTKEGRPCKGAFENVVIIVN